MSKSFFHLIFTDSLVMETFRMGSGVFMIRHNQQDTQFTAASSGKTYKIRAGDKVMMYPPALHNDPEIFDKPEVSRRKFILVIEIIKFDR